MKRITIIGAGPSGSHAAKLLAEQGHQVRVFEEHPCIGKPVQCTGIVTKPFQDIMGTDDQSFVINKIDTIRIFAPNSNSIEFKFKHADWIIDRTKFDQTLAKRAQDAGATYYTQHHFLGFKKKKLGGMDVQIKDTAHKRTLEVETDILIGADGPSSSVAKSAGILGKREYFFGVQPIIEFENDNAIEVYPAKTGFCWVTPIGKNKAKAGIAAHQNANSQLKAFMTKRFGESYQKIIIETEGGLVPVFNPKQKVEKDNVYLIGDASSAAKATTAGGIIQGLLCAQALADSFSQKKSYQKLWQERLGKEMDMHLRIRKMLNKFTDKDYNNIVEMLKNKKTKNILETYSRDYPTAFAIKLAAAEPRLLLYLRYMI